ncbi:VOC family protein [Hyphobacterium marinum]|uniref:VOC family protein n=1 Tax=Hyphobacterium marinum TaxID=3116574 RepID=A0ABU7LW90_9PROT|nr:VOC family protein [Hyphobacterium sp. Y6023]MEE2565547.1 VOC family protein [Hyphobacterium sp. Y6023]
MRLNQLTLTVSDIARSKAFYERLGFHLLVNSPHYCRFLAPDGGTTFSIHAGEVTDTGGAVLYLETDNVDAEAARLAALGIAFETEPTDQSWLWREADFRDPDGHRWKLYHAGKNRVDPPWRVKP